MKYLIVSCIFRKDYAKQTQQHIRERAGIILGGNATATRITEELQIFLYSFFLFFCIFYFVFLFSNPSFQGIVMTVPGDHHVHLNSPERVATFVADFLQSNSSSYVSGEEVAKL